MRKEESQDIRLYQRARPVRDLRAADHKSDSDVCRGDDSRSAEYYSMEWLVLYDLQINLRKSDPNLNLARQTVSELAAVVILVSKQPCGPMDTPA